MVVTIYTQNEILDDVITEFNTEITHIATGDDDTTPVVTDTDLGNETYIEAVNNSSVIGSRLAKDILQDITENNGNDIKEVGLFDAASGGNLYVRTLSSVVSKDGNTEVFIQSLIDFDVSSE